MLDVFLIIPLLYGMVAGTFRGIFQELASLLAVLLGIYGARYFASDLAPMVQEYCSVESRSALLIAYVGIFLIIAIGLNIAAFLLTKLFKVIKLNWTNRLLGLFFGGVKWLLILSIFLNILALAQRHVPLIADETLMKSHLYHPIKKVVPTILPFFAYDNFEELIPKR